MYIYNLFLILKNKYLFIYKLYFNILININTLNIKLSTYLLLNLY